MLISFFLHNRKSNLKWKSNPRIYIIDSCCKQQTLDVFSDHEKMIRAPLPFPSLESSSDCWTILAIIYSLCLIVSRGRGQKKKKKKRSTTTEGNKGLCLPSICVYVSPGQLFVTPWTAAHQTPLSIGFFQARILEWAAISACLMLSILHSLSMSLLRKWG